MLRNIRIIDYQSYELVSIFKYYDSKNETCHKIYVRIIVVELKNDYKEAISMHNINNNTVPCETSIKNKIISV